MASLQSEGIRQRKNMPHVFKDVDAAELQLMDRSPVQTPSHTRSNTMTTMTGLDNFNDVAAENATVMQGLDRSPTKTPHHTRAASMVGRKPRAHTKKQAAETMAFLHAMYGDEEGKDYIEDIDSDIEAAINGCIGPQHASVSTRRKHPKKSRSVAASSNVNKIERYDHTKSVLVAVEDGSANVKAATKMKYLAVYFAVSLALLLFNKIAMIEFPLPFILTALNCVSGIVVTQALYYSGYYTVKPISTEENMTIFGFSIIFTATIVVSNSSLASALVAKYQMLRAMTPIFTIMGYRLFFRHNFAPNTYLSLVPVILGTCLAAHGDEHPSELGTFATFLGAALAAVFAIVTNRLQTAGARSGTLELLYRALPLVFVQSLLMAYLTGETAAFASYLASPNARTVAFKLLIHGTLAFGITLTSFVTNRNVGALTMTTTTNITDVFTILLTAYLSDFQISFTNGVGILMALLGWICYASIALVGGKPKPVGEN